MVLDPDDLLLQFPRDADSVRAPERLEVVINIPAQYVIAVQEEVVDDPGVDLAFGVQAGDREGVGGRLRLGPGSGWSQDGVSLLCLAKVTWGEVERLDGAELDVLLGGDVLRHGVINPGEGVGVGMLGSSPVSNCKLKPCKHIQPPEQHGRRLLHGVNPLEAMMVSAKDEVPVPQKVFEFVDKEYDCG